MAKTKWDNAVMKVRLSKEQDWGKTTDHNAPVKPSPYTGFKFQPGFRCPQCGQNRKSKIHKAHMNNKEKKNG